MCSSTSRAFAAMAVVLISCGGGSEGGAAPPTNLAPTVEDVQLSVLELPPLRPGEEQVLRVGFRVADPDSDVAWATVTIAEPGGAPFATTAALPPGTRSGTGSVDLVIDDRYVAGSYPITVAATDATGLASAPASSALTISASAASPLEVTGVVPASGRPGEAVTISGRGFETSDPSANEVLFGGALARAEVLSATGTELSVRVPAVAASGPLSVRTPRGRCLAPSEFTVVHTVTVEPAEAQLVAGHALQLSCLEAGAALVDLAWSIEGQASPDPALGSLDARGLYTAPAAAPAANPVHVRCASRAEPSVTAEAVVTVVAAVADPGTGVVGPQGGEVRSAGGEVTVAFPPGAVGAPTPIAVAPLDPAPVAALTPDHVYVAGASFTSPGPLSAPARVTFALSRWIEPGTALPLVGYDGGAVSDPGIAAVVDGSGLLAAADVPHLSSWLVAQAVPASRRAVAARRLRDVPDPFVPRLPPGIGFTEGLLVPFLVEPAQGGGSGAGPFLPGTRARVRLGAGAGALTLTPRLVQPSGDGWSLGLVVQLPVLQDCGAGRERDAALIVDYGLPSGEPGTLTVPFDVECLDELVFDDSPPSPLPAGASQEVSGGRRIVTVQPGARYRFSRVHVGPNGVLRVAPVASTPPEPLSLEVTYGVVILGEIEARGTDGARGEHGHGNDDAGAGGAGGLQGGGKGGAGGPTGQDKRGKDGMPGLYPPWGGAGGAGGIKWDNASWISVIVSGAKVLWSMKALVAAPTELDPYGGIIAASYGAYDETVKYNHKDENRVRSAGLGGRAGRAWDPGAWWSGPPVPRAGGGGGGSGKMEIEVEADNAGAGGGGGGGAAPNVEIIAGDVVLIGEGAGIRGAGGSGGRGGNGSSYSTSDQAAPGGGGAGGSGAGLHVVSRLGLGNNGFISLAGGEGHLGGEILDDDGVILLPKTFGEHGAQGVMKLDGRCDGNCLFYAMRGAFFPAPAPVSPAAAYDTCLYPGDPMGMWQLLGELVNGAAAGPLVRAEPPGWNPYPCSPHSYDLYVRFPLDPGLNQLSVRRDDLGVEPHPWLRGHVFHFPGLADADRDGLPDELEQRLGSDPQGADPDGDGVGDYEELLEHGTDPLAADTDGDGFDDGAEVAAGTDPLDPAEDPGADADGDGLPDAWERRWFGDLSEGPAGDPDLDGLSNAGERGAATSPVDPDTDGDGSADGAEVTAGSDPLDPASRPELCDGADNDRDGTVDESFPDLDGDHLADCVDPDDDADQLPDGEEVALGTDPRRFDTDGDALGDGAEVRSHLTSPLLADTDGDDLDDGREVQIVHSSPLQPDTDGDGLDDGDEVNVHRTDPLRTDTDGDQLSDRVELETHRTDPADPDTDGDGYDDGFEVRSGTDPLDPRSYPGGDADDDGLDDVWEISHFGGISAQGPQGDPDRDFLVNLDEQAAGTDPTANDTDGDGAWDGTEHDFGSAPLDPASRPERCNAADDDRDGTVDDGACEIRPDHRATQFLVGFLPPQPGDAVSASLRIAAERPATVTVRYPARAPTFTRTVELGAQSVATVELPASAASGWSAGAVADNAVQISATQEVSVSLRHASEGVDVALAIPEGLLGTEYVAITRDGYGQSYPDAAVLVIATVDGTTVTITRPPPFGQPITFALGRGQGYLLAAAADLSGTTVRASSPVAVLHGNRCSPVPEASKYCEHLLEMAVPARFLGRDHAAASHRDGTVMGEPRRTLFRIVAPLPGTSVRANGTLLDLGLGPGGHLDHYVEGPGLVRFLSDRPIEVVSYMTSVCDWTPWSPACRTPPDAIAREDWGDPTVMTIPAASRLPWSYVFQGEPLEWGGLSQTWLYVLAHAEDVDLGHVLLDGIPLDPAGFAAIPDTPGYRWGVFPLAGEGVHTSRSIAGHGLWLVGLAPFGAASQPLGILLHDTVPEPPDPVSATAVSATQIQVSWADASTNETGFRVYRTNVSPQVVVGTAPANATGLLVGDLAPATTFQYRVRAFNALGEGSASAAATATTQPAPSAPPAAPSGLAAVAVPGDAGQVARLQWLDNSTNEEGFGIYRCVYADPYWMCLLDRPSAEAAPNATSFVDAGVSPGRRYRYTLRAFNLAGTSASSNTVEVLVP